MPGKMWFIRWFWLFNKKSNIFIWSEICKRTHCPSIVTLALLLFLSQTIRAEDLKFWGNVHPPACVTCHMHSDIFLISCSIVFPSPTAFSFPEEYAPGLTLPPEESCSLRLLSFLPNTMRWSLPCVMLWGLPFWFRNCFCFKFWTLQNYDGKVWPPQNHKGPPLWWKFQNIVGMLILIAQKKRPDALNTTQCTVPP